MAGLEVKNASSPDETRELAGKGHVDILSVGGKTVLVGEWKPGWRWSEHVKPIVGTDSCEAPHLIYCLSGRMHILMNDGTEAEIGPGDVVSIEPGHDAWVVGDEPCVGVDFGGHAQYGKG